MLWSSASIVWMALTYVSGVWATSNNTQSSNVVSPSSLELDAFTSSPSPSPSSASSFQCGGRHLLLASSSSSSSSPQWLADGKGNYSTDSQCTWLIESSGSEVAKVLRLHLQSFATECGWDNVYIFDGDSVHAPLKAVYSGLVRHERYESDRVPEVRLQSGAALVHFYSDVAYNMSGFNISFSVDGCPSSRHDLTCSGHGYCDTETLRCQCDEDFKGKACQVPACPFNCAPQGVHRGRCSKTTKKCLCFAGFKGEDCSQQESFGFWNFHSFDESMDTNGHDDGYDPANLPRASHVLVASSTHVYSIGGEYFGQEEASMISLFVPHADNNGNGIWKPVTTTANKRPALRYGHTAVFHDEKIYVYGGTLVSGRVSKDIWSFDVDSMLWTRLAVNQGRCLANAFCGPLSVTGHSAHVIANRMLVIFGYAPNLGFVNAVQEYHFGNKEWSVVPTSGYPVRGGFAHSSVWDEITKRIFVYGGYVSSDNHGSMLSDKLYALDPVTKRWSLMSSPHNPRFLHTAVASHGLMLVFGGNTHNDTAFSQKAKCYSDDVLYYDMICDKWVQGEQKVNSLQIEVPRFGHAAVVYNESIFIHGGFNGKLKNDLIVFVPGDCTQRKSYSACLGRNLGIKCVWDAKKKACLKHPPTMPKPGIQSCMLDDTDLTFEEDSPKPSSSSSLCSSMSSCSTCVSTSASCSWCGSHCSSFCDFKKLNATFKALTRWEECLEYDSGARDTCPRFHTCQACLRMGGELCSWDGDKVQRCREARTRNKGGKISHSKGDDGDNNDSKNNDSKADGGKGNNKDYESKGSGSVCEMGCSERRSCSNCTSGPCMWCHNLNLCIERNAYLASFPYGQCMLWTTWKEQCRLDEDGKDPKDMCEGYNTCDGCRENPACGWCDDGSGTGTGTCHMGGAKGVYVKENNYEDDNKEEDEEVERKDRNGEWKLDTDICPLQLTNGGGGGVKSWHFTSCPSCQCNGHSTCVNNTGRCVQPCEHHTMGEHCDKCAEGFFGNPLNGGTCRRCECNGQAARCDSNTGRCHCATKGIVGEHCDKCDSQNHYYGDPSTDSCFYKLTIDYQFTFNLSKSDDRHFTAINFRNEPTKADVDVDFSISCSVNAKMNLTYRYTSEIDGELITRRETLYSNKNCSHLKEHFSKNDFIFGDTEANTTFFVYVYDFEPPLWIVISFSQHPKLDILQFFVTFSTCFIALLLVAAILWKIKQRYDRYRRRQRLFVEMEQMASRPFGSVLLEVDQADLSDACMEPLVGNRQGSKGVKRGKGMQMRPGPIALEPCEGNKAAVLSLLVRLPTGGGQHAPAGCTGIAVASAIVSLGSTRKHSGGADPNRVNVDSNSSDPKRSKGRHKNNNNNNSSSNNAPAEI